MIDGYPVKEGAAPMRHGFAPRRINLSLGAGGARLPGPARYTGRSRHLSEHRTGFPEPQLRTAIRGDSLAILGRQGIPLEFNNSGPRFRRMAIGFFQSWRGFDGVDFFFRSD